MHGLVNSERVHELIQLWSILNPIMEQIKLQCLCSVEPKVAA